MSMKPISSISLVFLAAALACHPLEGQSQRTLSLDSCRALAINNNKKLGMSRVNRGIAEDVRRAARTDYLPKVDGIGTYQFTSREFSLLSKSQQNALNNLGTTLGSQLQGDLAATVPDLVKQGTISARQAQTLSNIASQLAPGTVDAINKAGSDLRKAFRTNTRNLFSADIMVRQPVYMGGAVKAANKAAEININLANDNIDLMTQNTLYDVDQAYWLVVSLRQKQLLANQYLDLVKKLHDDVSKMLGQGVATKANELKVAVRVNEAEMSQTQVDDGLVLAKIHLCQICGLDLKTDIHLDDEDINVLSDTAAPSPSEMDAFGVASPFPVGEGVGASRPELRLLNDAVELSKQNTVITRAAFLPQVLATGGYLFSNPNVLNGYRNTFSGLFHVGVTLRVHLWNWGEGRHKIRASKAATTMAKLELADTSEKIDLQIQQAEFRVKEAYKKLNMATHNLTSAEENLRCANVGFKEGVMQTTDVMEAQTAWQSALSQKIDAEIDVRMAHVNLSKAMGILGK